MSHGARVIRTGVSSGGPAAPPAAATASSSAGSDAELMDGAYFRSCAGMLKVAQMVRGERGGRRPLGPLGPSARAGVALTPAECPVWGRVRRAASSSSGGGGSLPVLADLAPRLSQPAGKEPRPGSSGEAGRRGPSEAAFALPEGRCAPLSADGHI